MEVKHRRIFDCSVGHAMKIAQAIIFVALGVFLIGFGIFTKVALWPLAQEGFWAESAVVLICFGVLQAVAGIAARVARMTGTIRYKKISGDNVARLLAAFPGPLTLKASRTGWVMMGFCVLSTALCIIFGVIAFLGQQAGNKSLGDLAEPAFETGLGALVAGVYSACALLRGALQLDRNGFQATLFSRKQYLWTEVWDFRIYYNGVQFSVRRPRLLEFDKLGNNYGLNAEELADLMESWQNAALDGRGDERPRAAAVSE